MKILRLTAQDDNAALRMTTPSLCGIRDALFFLSHISTNLGEQRRAQITLTRIRQHAQNRRPARRLGGDLHRTRKGTARRNTDENPLLLSKLTTPLHRLRRCDREHLVDVLHTVRRELRNEIRAPTLYRM